MTTDRKLESSQPHYVLLCAFDSRYIISNQEIKKAIAEPPKTYSDILKGLIPQTSLFSYWLTRTPIELLKPFPVFKTVDALNAHVEQYINDYIVFANSIEAEAKSLGDFVYPEFKKDKTYLETLLKNINEKTKTNTYWILECKGELSPLWQALVRGNVFPFVTQAHNAGTQEVIYKSTVLPDKFLSEIRQAPLQQVATASLKPSKLHFN